MQDTFPGATERAAPRILVVEDTASVRRVAVGLLLAAGFEPVGVDCLAAAIAALTAQPGRFDALLVDLGLPDGGPDDVIAALVAVSGGAPIVAMSGTPRDAPAGAAAFVEKPFRVDALARVLRGAMEAATAQSAA